MYIPAVAARAAAARQNLFLEFRSAGHKFFSRRGAGNFFFRTAVAGTEKAHSWCLTRAASQTHQTEKNYERIWGANQPSSHFLR